MNRTKPVRNLRATTGLRGQPPALRHYVAWSTLFTLPPDSCGPHGEPLACYRAALAAGYTGAQSDDVTLAQQLGMPLIGSAHIHGPGMIDEQAQRWAEQDYEGATIYLGDGFESDEEMLALAHEVVESAATWDLPIYVETHRGTATQDMYRTLRLIERCPELRFNGDFSHWYTGQELPSGNFLQKLARLEPVFVRTRFLHGRIGDAGCMQIDLGDGNRMRHPSIAHFEAMWRQSFRGFLASAVAGDIMIFVPELLSAEYQYARLVSDGAGNLREVGDRWTQALLLMRLADAVFADELRSWSPGRVAGEKSDHLCVGIGAEASNESSDSSNSA